MLQNSQIMTGLARQSPGGNPPVYASPLGDVMVSELLGKYANLSLLGAVFWGSTLAAGTIIPVNAANLVSTFTLLNPVGSGKNLMLIAYILGLTTTVAVVSNIDLVYQAGIGSSTPLPTSQTALTPTNAIIGGGAQVGAKLLSAGTLTGTPTFLSTLGINLGTTAQGAGPLVAKHEFDGTVIIPEGVLVTPTAFAAQTAAMNQTFIWAELPNK